MDSKIALEEFLFNCKENDIIKAALVLDHFDQIEQTQQRRILFELNKTEEDFSIPLFIHLIVANESAVDDYPTIVETLLDKSGHRPDVIVEQIAIPSPEQFYYVKISRLLSLQDAVPSLLEALDNTSDEKVLIEIFQSLGKLGNKIAVKPIGAFLLVESRQLVYQAVIALLKIKGAESRNMIAKGYGKGEKIDLAFLSAFAVVKNDFSLKMLNLAVKSGRVNQRNFAKVKMAEVGVVALSVLSENLFANDTDLQIHSLNILQDIGDPNAIPAVRKLLNRHPEDQNVRFTAYETLANLPGQKGDYVLATGLTDNEDSIRLAAAQAINNNLSPVLLSGIQNMIAVESDESHRIARAIIDAQTSDLALGLLENPFFKKFFITYMKEKAHPELKNHYLNLLPQNGYTDVFNLISVQPNTKKSTKTRKVVCAVDDSRMILNIYRSVLNDLGFEPVLFEYPEEFLKSYQQIKPELVFTDLNMPEINGIKLIETVRKDFGPEELPVVMVTTQRNSSDDQSANQAGANKIISKPFNLEKIKAVFEGMNLL